MGGIPENTHIPGEHKPAPSNSSNYNKAQESSSPIVASVKDAPNENEKSSPSVEKKTGLNQQRIFKQVSKELDDLLWSIGKLRSEVNSKDIVNRESRVTSEVMHKSRGISYDPDSCLLVLKDAEDKLLEAKRSNDSDVISIAVLKQSQTVRLIADYMYNYGINMDISAHNWLLFLNITKSTSFAIASAAGASVLGGSFVSGIIAGASAGFLDNVATEISKGINDVSGGGLDAIITILQGTATGAAFAFAGGILGSTTKLGEILSHSNVFINMASNSAYNLTLDPSFWGSIAQLANKVANLKTIDFDYKLPFEIQSYLIHKRAADIDFDIQIDSKTGRYVNRAPDHPPMPVGRRTTPMFGVPAVLSPANEITGMYDGQRIIDKETYLRKNKLAEDLNKEEKGIPGLILDAQAKFDEMGAELETTISKIWSYQEAVAYWKNDNGTHIYLDGDKFVNHTITGSENNMMVYNYSNDYQFNSRMERTYLGKTIVSKDDFVDIQTKVTALNDGAVPAIKRMAYLRASMEAYLSVILDALHSLRA